MVHSALSVRTAHPQHDPIGKEGFERDTHCATRALATMSASPFLEFEALNILNRLSKVVFEFWRGETEFVVERQANRPLR